MMDSPSRRAPRGFIFDLDGVLVDTVPAHIQAWGRTFREFGYSFSAELYEQKIDGRPRLEALRVTMTDLDEQRLAQAAEIKNNYFLRNIEEGLFNRFESSNRFVLRWRERGVRMAAASSSVNVKSILEKIGLVDAFDVIVGGDDVSLGKPDPEVFLSAAQGLGLAVDECVVFEDAAVGVQAAKRGGFFCVGVHRYGDLARLAGADVIINDLDQLTDDAVASFGNRASRSV
jgi:beta-phosphoglucomutase family hydrolase